MCFIRWCKEPVDLRVELLLIFIVVMPIRHHFLIRLLRNLLPQHHLVYPSPLLLVYQLGLMRLKLSSRLPSLSTPNY